MDEPIKQCIDRPIPADLIDEADLTAFNENPANALNPLEIAGLKRYFWLPGRTLKVRYMDGDPLVQARVAAVAQVWSNYANIRFEFGDFADAEIRISFQHPGSWSYIGTVALNIPADQATMNYGWLTPTSSDEEVRRVVLHEFGHALGFIHEHQNPANGIPWDIDAVYAYYMGPPNNWTKEQVDFNVLNAYDTESTQYTEFDPHSIMLYPVSNALTLGDFEIPWRNSELSPIDQSFAGEVYRKPAAKYDAAFMAPNGKLYIFSGNRYTRYTPGQGTDAGYPKPIKGNWGNWPDAFADGIDAAFALNDGKYYFLKGDQYVRYTPGRGVDNGFPQPIAEGWPDLKL